jgi:hypothetical protein
MRIHDREELLSLFFSALVPLFMVANFAYFLPIYDWLHAMDEPSSGSEAHLSLWFLLMLTLAVGGLLYAGKGKKRVLQFIYGVLLALLLLSVMFIGAMAGAGQGVKT